jgi:pyruvate formate lyase activating enzyme
MEKLGPDVPLHFTAFHPDWKMRDKPPTPPSALTRAQAIARAAGLRYVYTGNVHDESGQSTYCASCGERLIGRDWYDITAWGLDAEGRCGSCGAPCPGTFEAYPGRWGARRASLSIEAA